MPPCVGGHYTKDSRQNQQNYMLSGWAVKVGQEQAMAADLELDLANIPSASGVYLMYGAGGRVLYVGKACNLRTRLRNYVRGADSRTHIHFLLRKVTRVETIVTDTEKEALILENTLIKKHKPRYNINLRDDKTYVSLRLDMQEPFPALRIVRRVRNDGAVYFGPYASAADLRATLKQLYRVFPLRHHRWQQCRSSDRPCLYYQIGQCSAPCHGHISDEDYALLVQQVSDFLRGRYGQVLTVLAARMEQAAQAMRYEEAAALRDQIRAIEHTLEKQKMVSSDGGDIDVIGIDRDGGTVEVCILFVRGGRVQETRAYSLRWSLDEAALLAGFLQQYYGRGNIIPPLIIMPVLPDGHQLVQQWLSERRGRKVTLTVPQRGERLQLVRLAGRNAAQRRRERGAQQEERDAVLEDIRRTLGLRRLPRRMECFDISHIQGSCAVGSMVVASDGVEDKGAYRHYRINGVSDGDDYAALRQVLQRRLRRGLEENNLPDMLLVDGGKGQLAIIETVLAELHLAERIDLVSIAKSRVRANVRSRAVERSEERFFRPGRKNPVVLRRGSAALFMLERLRDEAHRFAITYHRKLRAKASLRSELDRIPGIGPARRKLLLKYFGSVKKIRACTREQLHAVPGLPGKCAEEIYRHFNADNG